MSSPDNRTAEKGPQGYLVPVALSGNLVGHQLTQLGIAFDADSLFGEIPKVRGESPNQYSAIYLRTRSGSVYKLVSKGEKGTIVGLGISRARRDKKTNESFWLRHVAGLGSIRIGKIFSWDYSNTRYTSAVTEVVGVLKQAHSPEEIERITGGKKSSILEDFRRSFHN